MNTLNFLDPLLSVASHGETRDSHRRSFWTGIKSEYLLPDFFSLAGKAVPGANTGLERALSAFFKPEVVRFLLQLPNTYWFYRLLRESVMVRAATPVSVDVADDRIDGAMMNLAVQRLRAKHVDGFDLSMPLLSLSPAELCARSVRGLILLRPRSDGKTEQIEVNPLLAAAAPVVA